MLKQHGEVYYTIAHFRWPAALAGSFRGNQHYHQQQYNHEPVQLLQSLCKNGQLEAALDILSGMSTAPSNACYVSLLKLCNRAKSMEHAKRVYNHISHHMKDYTILGDFLVTALANCGAMDEALEVSLCVSSLSLPAWNTLFSACATSGKSSEAIKLYQQMRKTGINPSPRTFIYLFKACRSLSDLFWLYKHSDSMGFTSDIYVGNTLINMYGKFGSITEAEDIFCQMHVLSTVSWNVMLSAYVEHGLGKKALQLLRQMQEEGFHPDQHTLVLALKACGNLVHKQQEKGINKSYKMIALEICRAIHLDIVNGGFHLSTHVSNSLISIYIKCLAYSAAENVFSRILMRDVVSWTTIISMYVDQGRWEQALAHFLGMQGEGISPDKVAFMLALQACCVAADQEPPLLFNERQIKPTSLEIGQALHVDADKKGYSHDTRLVTSLVSMYGKCGKILEAEIAFQKLFHTDLISWNAMLSSYVEQGEGEKALLLYNKMCEKGMEMDEVTFISILQACSKAGNLEVCSEIHFKIICTAYNKFLSLIATLVHTYGSCGKILDADVIFNEIYEPDAVSWTAYIAAHTSAGDCRTCMHILNEVVTKDSLLDEVMFTSILTACSHSGLSNEALEYFKIMNEHHGITPKLKHFGAMVHILGRAGDFKKIENMLFNIPMKKDLAMWLFLLGACRTHGNVELAKQAFDNAVELHPQQSTAYIVMSKIYVDAGLPELATEVEKLREIYVDAGFTWIHNTTTQLRKTKSMIINCKP